MARGVPRRNGSGRGRRANRGRGGCRVTRKVGRGRNRREWEMTARKPKPN